MADESIDDRLSPRALLAYTAQGDFDPRRAVRVGQLNAVVDADVESFQLRMEGPDGAEERKTALIGILLAVRPLIRVGRDTPEELRQSVDPRPRARIKMTCPIFEGGGAMLEMVRIDGPVDDVDPRTEGLQLEERVKRLLAARVLEELSAP